MRMKKEGNETLRAMERVWARHTLKSHRAQHGNCDCAQCREAQSILGSSEF